MQKYINAIDELDALSDVICFKDDDGGFAEIRFINGRVVIPDTLRTLPTLR